jgi:peptidoglycan/xylan/chitin deacetylase (PgdA/CDA1 family)
LHFRAGRSPCAEAEGSGVEAFAGRVVKAILTYHSIDESGSVVSVDSETFRRHAGFLARAKIPAVGLTELLRLPEEADAVAITFDDAFENFATVAWPILREQGLAVTLFVPTGHVGGKNGWESGAGGIPVLPLVGWSALGRLVEEGVTIGAHSEMHPDLTTVEPAVLRREIAGPVERIRRETGVTPDAFAYPYGALGPAVVAEVARHYAVAVTTELRWLDGTEDRHRLPRLDAYYLRRPGALEGYGSARFRRALTWRNRLRRVRQSWTGGK